MSAIPYNFKATHFPHSVLDRIVGQPTYESLMKCYKQVKANALSVPSNEGGGQLGHLGAVVDPARYAFVSNVPYVPPVHPGVLVFPPNSTQTAQRIIQAEREDQIRAHETHNAVIRQIKQQIEEAFDSPWLDSLRSPVTNTITDGIPDIFDHLFRLYGDVNPETLADREDQVRTMTYDPAANGVDTVYVAIKHLMDFADANGTPYTQGQVVNMATNIFRRTRRFGQAITEWNRAVTANQAHRTWVNFKNHFRQAHRELRERADLTANDTAFNTANLVQELSAAVRGQIADSVQEQLNMLAPTMPPPPAPEHIVPVQQPPMPPPPVFMPPQQHPMSGPPMMVPQVPPVPFIPPPNPQANVMSQGDIASVMQNVMNLQQQTIQQMQNMMNNRGGNGGGRRNRGGNRGGRGGRGGQQQPNQQQQQQNGAQQQQQQQQTPRAPDQYCWTHGMCRHNGGQCRTPAQGHVPHATAYNRFGGNASNLPPGFL